MIDFNWKIMIITSLPDDPAQKHLMQDSLTNGEWYVDNNKLPEQTSLAHRVSNTISLYLNINCFYPELYFFSLAGPTSRNSSFAAN